MIVVSSGGYFSFALERRPNVGGALFAALIASLLIVLGEQRAPQSVSTPTNELRDRHCSSKYHCPIVCAAQAQFG